MSKRAEMRPVIVGDDGSDGARSALLWATRATQPGRPIETVTADGDPSAVLLDLACTIDAGLIVVGHRRGRRLAELRGSVALTLIDEAPCPVVVVPDAIGQGGPTLVGYDGSENARAALHWAMAHDRGGRGLVIATTARDRRGSSLPPPLGLSVVDRTAIAAAVLDELLLEDDLLVDAEYTPIAVDGHPGEALAALADQEDAQEIVIGRGPHAHEIVEHASRPVIVVPSASSERL